MSKKILFLFLVHFGLLLSIPCQSQIKLPRFISDGMILQRETELKIWGWASPNETVSIAFADRNYSAKANDMGEWQIKLEKLSAGGPHTMTLMANDTIILKDILIGDVWFCSGQSNMELPMKRVSWVFPDEIENSENSRIRQFYVPRKFEFNNENKDISSGSWVKANPVTIMDFSATAYFFAKEIYKTYQVPVGIINSAYGGSPVEAWISEAEMKKFPEYYKEFEKCKDNTYIEQVQKEDNLRSRIWHTKLHEIDKGYQNPEKPWYSPDLNVQDWKTLQIPGNWEQIEPTYKTGSFWFRKTFQLPSTVAGKQGLLILGRIIDSDSVFVNGKFVGSTGYQYPPRRYNIPDNLLKEGENTITIRLISEGKNGGFVEDKNYELNVGDYKLDLKGNWKFAHGAEMEPSIPGRTFFSNKPVGLYNAMIHPFINYSIKGILWYQGESNGDRPWDYQELFSNLIRNWREKWQQPDLPFVFMQLPNFQKANTEPTESNWALLREAQLKTLSVPNTGMAVAIDLGEWNDIHPLNKKDVGYRLAQVAKNVAYKDVKGNCTGPLFQSFKTAGNKIIISFSNAEGGLISKNNGELKQFSIAGEDGKFVWAKAKINGNTVEVWNDAISKPVAVRYAWADNPEGANLYNKEGFPASPFRTDNWKR